MNRTISIVKHCTVYSLVPNVEDQTENSKSVILSGSIISDFCMGIEAGGIILLSSKVDLAVVTMAAIMAV